MGRAAFHPPMARQGTLSTIDPLWFEVVSEEVEAVDELQRLAWAVPRDSKQAKALRHGHSAVVQALASDVDFIRRSGGLLLIGGAA